MLESARIGRSASERCERWRLELAPFPYRPGDYRLVITDPEQTLVSENPFAIAQQQFDIAAEKLRIDPDLREVLRQCKREIIINFPVRMDDGTIRVFQGFRVQHNIVRGSAGRTGATAMGCVSIIRKMARRRGMSLVGQSAVIQGFGNAGAHLAGYLHELGVRIIAVSDSTGAVMCSDGLDIPRLRRHKLETRSVTGFPQAEPIGHAELLELPCDWLVPAALENQITAANAEHVRARFIVEAANGPTTPEADRILADPGIVVVPDILANAGGVTVSYFEWVQDLQWFFWDEAEISAKLDRLMCQAFEAVTSMAERYNVDLRTAATLLAIERIAEATHARGIYP